MKTWITYILVSQLTGSPLVGIAVVAAMWLGGTSWWFGRVPDVVAPFRRWTRVRRLREELAMNPHNLNVRTDLGGLLAVGSPAEAKELLEEVVRRCPELPLPAYFLGQALVGLGETEAGVAQIEKALAMKKDLRFGEPMVFLGDHYAKQGDHAKALAAYERALTAHSTHAEALFKAGSAAKGTGDAATARRRWEELVAVTRHAPAFKRRQDRLWRVRAWLALRGL